MSKLWDYLSALTDKFNLIFQSHESVDYVRARFVDPACIAFFAVCVLVGIVLSVNGYKLARFALFVTAAGIGITTGCGMLYPFIESHADLSGGNYVWLEWTLPIVITVIIFVFAYKFLRFALFAVGGLLGFYVAHWLAALVNADTVVTVIFVVLGILFFGIIIMVVRKAVLKIGLALLGALLSAYGVAGLLVMFGFEGLYTLSIPISFFVVLAVSFAYHICKKRDISSRFKSFEDV